MVMTERHRFANVLLSLSVVCLITILSIGITARVQRTDLQDESATVVISCGEEAGEVPYIIGYDEKKAGEILGEQGFALTISQAIIKRACRGTGWEDGRGGDPGAGAGGLFGEPGVTAGPFRQDQAGRRKEAILFSGGNSP